MTSFRSPNSVLRRGLAWSAGLLLVVLCAYGIWQSSRPRWRTYVSPPLTTHGIHLSFRYPAAWKQSHGASALPDYLRFERIELTPPPPSRLEMWWRKIFRRVVSTEQPLTLRINYAEERFTDIDRDEQMIRMALTSLARQTRQLSMIHRFKHPLGEALEFDISYRARHRRMARIYLKSSQKFIVVDGDPSSPEEQRGFDEVVMSLRLRP